MSDSLPRGFARYLRQARDIVQSSTSTRGLLDAVGAKLKARALSGRMADLKSDLLTMLALARAVVSGDYRDISKSSIVSVIGALAYFVAPLDVIPDFLLGWGLLDDATVIAYVAAQLKQELEQFRAWRDAVVATDGKPDELARPTVAVLPGPDQSRE